MSEAEVITKMYESLASGALLGVFVGYMFAFFSKKD